MRLGRPEEAVPGEAVNHRGRIPHLYADVARGQPPVRLRGRLRGGRVDPRDDVGGGTGIRSTAADADHSVGPRVIWGGRAREVANDPAQREPALPQGGPHMVIGVQSI